MKQPPNPRNSIINPQIFLPARHCGPSRPMNGTGSPNISISTNSKSFHFGFGKIILVGALCSDRVNASTASKISCSSLSIYFLLRFRCFLTRGRRRVYNLFCFHDLKLFWTQKFGKLKVLSIMTPDALPAKAANLAREKKSPCSLERVLGMNGALPKIFPSRSRR